MSDYDLILPDPPSNSLKLANQIEFDPDLFNLVSATICNRYGIIPAIVIDKQWEPSDYKNHVISIRAFVHNPAIGSQQFCAILAGYISRVVLLKWNEQQHTDLHTIIAEELLRASNECLKST